MTEEAGSHTGILQAWLLQLQSKDQTSFDQIRSAVIAHTSERLERLVRKMLRNYPRLQRWEQTDDVLQNSILRLHHSLSTIRPETARQFYGLAATQIHRELIDLSRHYFGPQGAGAKHHTDRVDATGSGGPTIERQADTHAEPESLEEWTAFHEAVHQLPDAEREVFQLYWYEGLDQKAIASLLDVSERTIKNRWRSAKLLLSDKLRPDDNGKQHSHDSV